MAFAACYGLSLAILYSQALDLNEQNPRIWTVDFEDQMADEGCGPDNRNIADSICTGFALGCRVATVAWIVMLLLFFWTPAIEFLDRLDILSLEGFLFSALPAIGALFSAAWPLSLRTVRRPSLDEEKGKVEEC